MPAPSFCHNAVCSETAHPPANAIFCCQFLVYTLYNSRMSEPLTSSNRAFLVLIRSETPHSPDLGRRYVIPSQGLLLGNQSQADVFLDKPNEAPIAVCVMRGTHGWKMNDLNGCSNVQVNGILAHKTSLVDGDILSFGRVAFEFCSGTGVKVEFFECNEKALIDDPLTHALNRRAWWQFVEQDLRRSQQWQEERRSLPSREAAAPMALLMLDVDHFKKFNDLYDHLVGDEVLKGVIARVKERVRGTDLVGRLGGEEFAIYLPHTAYQQAMELAEQIRARVAESQFDVGAQKQLAVTISVGVAQLEPGMDLKALVKKADDRMLQAKREGRNRVLGQPLTAGEQND